MKFGLVPVADSVGAIAAHSLKAGGVALKKGQAITPDAAAALEAAGIAQLVAVRLDAEDVGEDEAAAVLAARAAGDGLRVERPFTGRSNLFATRAGILRVDATVVDAVNGVDEAVTLATLPDHKPVVEGEMVATVKIIPYAVPGPILAQTSAAVPAPPLTVVPYRLRRVGVVSTLTPGFKPGIVDKTLAAFGRRLEPAGAAVARETRVAHETDALEIALRAMAEADVEMLVVFGASAIADRRDVIPAALEAAGGRIEHFGMPVDPGNLLLVGTLAGRPVIGAPGCARSPKENGFDWVLHRLLAGITVTGADIARMGVGGLLMEIVSRGQPRAGGDSAESDDE